MKKKSDLFKKDTFKVFNFVLKNMQQQKCLLNNPTNQGIKKLGC